MEDPRLSPNHEFIQVGTVLGVDPKSGWVKVYSQTDNPSRFIKGAELLIKEEVYTVQNSKNSKSGFLLEIDELDNKLHHSLIGEGIYVYLNQVPLNQEGYYYHFQLIGLKVINENLGFLGTITEILQTGANDVYVIQSNDSELLIPAIKSVVLSVDLPKKEMLVKIPDGLDSRPLKRVIA